MNISIHALREEGDEDALDFLFEVLGFLSTPSARRATGKAGARWNGGNYFYPRPPRGGRQYEERFHDPGKCISIHALREEGDLDVHGIYIPLSDFYPRPPRGGRHEVHLRV